MKQLTAMRIPFITILCFFSFTIRAQETSSFTKFGKITAGELEKKIYPIDSAAHAVVLSDIGEAAIQGNNKSWFSISFTRHRVVHILNKNGYDEANVEIDLYKNGDAEERLQDLKAVTYNLEMGKISESKLEKSSLFKEEVDKNHLRKKFTFPNVKEGSIIEYEYKVVSDFIWNLDPWQFQGSSPVLWSEFTLTVPQFFRYAFISHGFQSFYIQNQKDRRDNFTVIDSRNTGSSLPISFSAGVTDYRWVMKNVPELREESYTSSIKNHISRIEFQLASQSDPLQPHDYRNTWTGLCKELLESDKFGHALNNNNNWLSEDIKPLLNDASSQTEKAKRIYAFVRDHFTCINHNALLADQSLKNVMRTRKGSVAEINLLLTAILRYAGLTANPVILSTTSHGYAWELYPLTTNFNYVVSQCKADNKVWYLDATRPLVGFGKLLPDCYNGHARVVDEAASPVYFSADSLNEKSITAVFITSNEKGNRIGSLNKTMGFYESYETRNKIKEKGEEEYFKDIQKGYGNDVKIKLPHVDSILNYEESLAVKYEVAMDKPTGDILYINPMFGEAWKKNPFKSAERYYPVEMPYTIDEMYLLTFNLPDGYVVDELPKQLVAKLDEQESAFFEYRISQSESTISLRTRIKISRTFFSNEEYVNLREFFNLIVNKQNEQIVLKKKK